MTLYRIHELINKEGPILQLLKDSSDFLYICGLTDQGRSKIICKTSPFNLQLYLSGRILLTYLFLLAESEHYIIVSGKNTRAQFFEITPENIPPEISGLQCGNELYPMIHRSCKSPLTISEIMEMLPKVKDGVELVADRFIQFTDSQVQFFSDGSPIKLSQIEGVYDQREFDYLSVPLNNSNGYLMCRLAPHLLKLYISNIISTRELFECQADKEYYYLNDKGIFKLFYTDGLKGFIETLYLGELTYLSLPPHIIIENSMETWAYYTRNIVISGHGVIPTEFRYEYPIEIKIKKG